MGDLRHVRQLRYCFVAGQSSETRHTICITRKVIMSKDKKTEISGADTQSEAVLIIVRYYVGRCCRSLEAQTLPTCGIEQYDESHHPAKTPGT